MRACSCICIFHIVNEISDWPASKLSPANIRSTWKALSRSCGGLLSIARSAPNARPCKPASDLKCLICSLSARSGRAATARAYRSDAVDPDRTFALDDQRVSRNQRPRASALFDHSSRCGARRLFCPRDHERDPGVPSGGPVLVGEFPVAFDIEINLRLGGQGNDEFRAAARRPPPATGSSPAHAASAARGFGTARGGRDVDGYRA
jgi:hypothetical protein